MLSKKNCLKVQLPDKEVTLAGYTIPDEKATMSHYNYVWTLVDQPSGGFTGKKSYQEIYPYRLSFIYLDVLYPI